MSNFTFTTKAAAVAAVSVIAFAGCKDDNDVHAAQMAVSQVKGQTMGTFYSVQVPKGYTGGNEALDKRANSAFNVVIDAISTFDNSAELARFNAYKGTDKFEISPYLADSIENALFADNQTATAGTAYIQIFSTNMQDNATRVQQKLSGITPYPVIIVAENGIYRVRIGPVPESRLNETLNTVKAHGFTDSFVKRV